MKFNYQYRTSDNVRHEGAVFAPDRETAFSILKARGIKPGFMEEAPGLANKLFGKGKRWIAIGVLAVALLAILLAYCRTSSRLDRQTSDLTSPMPRHQIYGDPALIEEFERTGFASVFEDEGERFLARYAQPGRIVRGAAVDPAVLASCVDHRIAFADGEERERVELKRIVLWMKGELKAYLAEGPGTIETYTARLNERQLAEERIYRDTVRELEAERDFDVWEQRNEVLRNLGLRTIPLPARDE